MSTTAGNQSSTVEIDEHLRARLEDWRRRLIDLSGRNRLIKFPATRHGGLLIESPSIHELLADLERTEPWSIYLAEGEEHEPPRRGTSAFGEEEQPIVRPPRPPKPGEIITRERDPKAVRRALERLARRANAEFDDKALRVLYLAAGFLDWDDPVRRERVSSPLILVPVELRRETARKPYRLFLVTDEDVVVNPALTIKLEKDVGLDVPGDWQWENKPLEDELAEIRHAVADRGWTVREDAVLGIFSFHKLVMYRDLLDNEGSVLEHSMVRALGSGTRDALAGGNGSAVPATEELDECQNPAEAFSILDADASQRRCIEAAKRGASFVMQGPPGTGKSQTIANIIAEGVAQGKRVLFVSEKIAALDVVFNRLDEHGLSDFCLKLHGEGSKRSEVVAELATTLTSEPVARPAMSNEELERLRQVRERLNAFVRLLHEPVPALLGRSPRTVYAELATLHDAPLPEGAPKASAKEGAEGRTELAELEEIFARLREPWRVATEPGFPWRGFNDRFDSEVRATLVTLVDEIRAGARSLADAAEDVARPIGLSPPSTHLEARRLLELVLHLERGPTAMPANWLTTAASDEVARALRTARAAHDSLRAAEAEFATAFPASALDDFSLDAHERLDAALRRLADVIGRTDAWEEELSRHLLAVGQFLRTSEEAINALRARGREVADALGQPSEGMTVDRARRLVELARLAFGAEQRPDRTWLTTAGLERARSTVAEVGPLLREYADKRHAVLEAWEPAVFELELSELSDRFEHVHLGRLSKLKRAYRRDAKTIKAARRDNRLPEEPVAALRAVIEVTELGARIDCEAPRLARAFGQLDQGRDTDPGHIEAACEVAEQAHRLMEPDSNLDRLARHLCAGSEEDPALAQAADRLEAELPGVSSGLSEFAPLLGARDGPDERMDLEALRDLLERYHAAVEPVLTELEPLLTARSGGDPRLSSLLREAQVIERAHVRRREVQVGEPAWSAELGERYQGRDTAWEPLENDVRWLEELFSRAGPALPDPLIMELRRDERSWKDLGALRERSAELRAAVERLSERFDNARGEEIVEASETNSLDELGAFCGQLIERVDDLLLWSDFRATRQRLNGFGWGRFVDALIATEASAEQVVPAFRRAYWHRRLARHFDAHPELGEFTGMSHGRLVDEFRRLDERLIRGAAERIIAARNAERPDPVVSAGSEVDLLLREASKKRKHMPVRTLLQRLPTLLPKLKPCLMMSPLAVSNFLTADHSFDLVVFDEASQVPPWDAVSCVYRGRQLVVAGDDKQLPPTAFFQRSDLGEEGYDEESEGAEEVMDSILDSCVSLLDLHPLRWHYRSHHEHLISFSNHHFYSNQLVTFPSPEQMSPLLGVSLTYVPEGVYDRGRSKTNRIEARKAVERLTEYLLDGTGRSVGLIAFSSAQQDAIMDELERERRARPELEALLTGDRLDAVFVKNLESVQGDERDVILFSVGYGKDTGGRFTLQLGPLNSEGGHRRLNVAVTRARQQVEVVTSVLAHDFAVTELTPPGVRRLRDYLEFAERGPAALKSELGDMGGDFESPFEEAVAETIRGLGYDIVPQVGVGGFRVDLGVGDPGAPGRFVLGVECDGATYHSTPTARDRDRLREEVLRNLGWSIHRIWSWDWVRDRRREVKRLEEAIRDGAAESARKRGRLEELLGRSNAAGADAVGLAGRNEDARSEVVTSTAGTAEPVVEVPGSIPDSHGGSTDVRERARRERPVHDLSTRDGAVGLSWVETYRRADLPPQDSFYEFHESVNRRVQAELVRALLHLESPVSISYVVRRVAEAWGIQRAGHRVVGAVEQAINQIVRAGDAELRGDFVWRPGQVLDHVRIPDEADDRTRRGINDIPPEEIDLAILQLRDQSGQRTDDRLIAQVARLLGFDRTGGKIRGIIAERVAAQR